MDGFQTETGVIVMAATNRPDVLDPALTRPGRFDRTIVVTLPDIKAREEILNLHMRKKPMADSVDIKVLARATAGLSGANLENLANEAALLAARKGKDKIEMTDLEEAKDKVLMGVERRSLVISEGEKRIIAYHEAGHTLVQKQLPEVYPVHKVTIIPRGQALGITHILPEEDSFIESDTYYRNSICTLMAGRSAEKLVFDKVFTGAENDLKVATEIARKMVCEWGMSKNLGPVSYHHNEAVFLGRDIVQQKEYSEETSREIDSEIRRILEEAEKNAMEILKQHRDKLDKLATELLKRETLNSEEIDEVLGLKPSGETSKPLETVDKASHLPLFPEVKEEENKGEKETNGPE
jgi:cell division protease FtsH